MKYRLFLSVATAGVLGSTAFAGTMGLVIPSKDLTWVGSIAAGPIWARSGETQTFYLAPEIEKTYAARISTNALASGELFVGIQKSLTSQWLGQLGLAAATTGNAKLQGVIWDDADPQFDNYSYLYKVRNSRIAVKGKLLLDNGYWVLPWVSASLGVGFNRAHDFTNTPLIFEALPNSNFADHTKTAFTYTLGAGVQKSLNDHWQIGVGYEFADWGQSELGRAHAQTMNSGLTLNHLYTNGVLFNLTYIA
ncbi:outer membrane protein [Legionella pneumophila]|uniref:outer membrane protein n=1 Tax=Legionella pneumophila TaxID=446 RepID=UPI00048AC1AE|nr:outer membrane beta-barrel protein [Legionella pneumophila]RYB35490.1 porin family protein [Legionella pneumophila]RYW23867.1 porin family protein [Legionella pneumophila]HAT1868660.1 porin family protein [Legionella pneumophila]HAT1906227.1 porin family protein [Legionella pneumophila]HAT1917297.1 porin family protein [Legionella pneumophila]